MNIVVSFLTNFSTLLSPSSQLDLPQSIVDDIALDMADFQAALVFIAGVVPYWFSRVESECIEHASALQIPIDDASLSTDVHSKVMSRLSAMGEKAVEREGRLDGEFARMFTGRIE